MLACVTGVSRTVSCGMHLANPRCGAIRRVDEDAYEYNSNAAAQQAVTAQLRLTIAMAAGSHTSPMIDVDDDVRLVAAPPVTPMRS